MGDCPFAGMNATFFNWILYIVLPLAAPRELVVSSGDWLVLFSLYDILPTVGTLCIFVLLGDY